jgi:hypothetical protein
MADKTQTYGSTGGYDKVTAALQELNGKLQGISGTASTLSKGLSDIEDTLTNPQSQFFAGMVGALSSSMKTALKDAESERRIYESAKEQNAEAMRRSGAEPVRGQADFWSQAFSPVSKSPIEVQTEALKATFNDAGVRTLLKDSLSSATIRSAVNSDVDERTTGQKVLDTLTLGVTKDVRGILDRFSSGTRAQKAEEKAIQKDQGTIKREKKQVDQLSAQYRALKAKNTDGQNDEKMQRILAELQERTQIIKDAEKRIDERKADPFADLAEVGQGNEKVPVPGGKPGQPNAGPAQGGTWMPQGLQLPLPVKIMDSLESKVSKKPEDSAPGITGRKDSTTPASNRSTQSVIGDDRRRTQDVTGDLNEPVEMSRPFEGGAVKEVRDNKEAQDIQRYLDTRLRPEFYQEGTKFFKKANGGELLEDLKSSIGTGGTGMSMGKGGVYAALGAATLAAGAKIVQASMLAKEWITSAEEAEKVRQQIYADGIAANEKKKVGWNDEARDATTKSMKADQELDEAKNSWWVGIKNAVGHAVGVKTELDEKKEAAEAANLDRQLANRKLKRMTDAAREAGVDTNDTVKMNRFSKEYEERKRQKVMSNANPESQTPQDTVATPAANVDTSKVITNEEQTKRLEEAMYNGSKRALMDREVQDQNEQNARKQGEMINESLVGRK